MKFELNEEQTMKFVAWEQQQRTKGRSLDATGFRYSFIFSPTSMGICVKVKDHVTGEELDLSEEI